ncbi:MAG: hypothetical protein WCP06_10445 [Verrucomicrobiota bacterium]
MPEDIERNCFDIPPELAEKIIDRNRERAATGEPRVQGLLVPKSIEVSAKLAEKAERLDREREQDQ